MRYVTLHCTAFHCTALHWNWQCLVQRKTDGLAQWWQWFNPAWIGRLPYLSSPFPLLGVPTHYPRPKYPHPLPWPLMCSGMLPRSWLTSPLFHQIGSYILHQTPINPSLIVFLMRYPCLLTFSPALDVLIHFMFVPAYETPPNLFSLFLTLCVLNDEISHW